MALGGNQGSLARLGRTFARCSLVLSEMGSWAPAVEKKKKVWDQVVEGKNGVEEFQKETQTHAD